ncbi:MAG: flagellar hook-basal body protein [Hydrogenoanaerobacterium sp.]
MSIGFYTGVSGMMSYQKQMDIIAHNIANVNTHGFKSSRASFEDLLYTQMNVKVEGDNKVGHGTKIAGTDVSYGKQGGIEQTGYALDFAITGGDGLFAVDKMGKTEYTRNGAFGISIEGKKGYLVTDDGAYVLDKKGKSIALQLDKNGSPVVDGAAARVGVYVFKNPYGLIPTTGSRFLESGTSGTATELSKVRKSDKGPNAVKMQVMQYSLERSNVDLGQEMIDVIQAQRAFQLNAKVVQTADQLDEVINNLR